MTDDDNNKEPVKGEEQKEKNEPESPKNTEKKMRQNCKIQTCRAPTKKIFPRKNKI